ncbi:TPA: hypothetical protein ACXEV6_004437 [Serratia marcescens]
MNKLGEVWDYLTKVQGHSELWMLERPLLPEQKVRCVTSRYSCRPIIVTRSGRTLAILDLLSGQWLFTGAILKALPSDTSSSDPTGGTKLDEQTMFSLRFSSEFDITGDLR